MVPFSPAAGLLEWVEDTVPLGRYLIGEDRMSGAHRRYARPGELSFFESYTAMDKGQREGRPRHAFDKVQDPQLSCPKTAHHMQEGHSTVHSSDDLIHGFARIAGLDMAIHVKGCVPKAIA